MSLVKSKYKILKEHNLIVEYHSGIIDAGTFIDFKKKIAKDPLFLPNSNYFVYLKNVTLITATEDIDRYIKFFGSNSNVYGNRRVALITDTPNQVVFATMFKMMQQNTSQSIEIFSTNESALEWLNSNLTINEILDVLTALMLP